MSFTPTDMGDADFLSLTHEKHRHCIECRACLPSENQTDYCGDDDECVGEAMLQILEQS